MRRARSRSRACSSTFVRKTTINAERAELAENTPTIKETKEISAEFDLQAGSVPSDAPRDVVASGRFSFVTSYNWYIAGPSGKATTGAVDAADISYLDKYCRDNPNHAFGSAAVVLLERKSMGR